MVGSESGAVCFLDDREGSQKLQVVLQVGFAITSLTVDFDRESIWLGGRGRKMQRLSFETLRSSTLPSPMSPARREKIVVDKKSKIPAITCMGSLSSHLVTVEASREIHIYPIEGLRDEGEQEHGDTSMPAHRDPVLGIRRLDAPQFSASFFTWSRNGSVIFWDASGKCLDFKSVALEQNCEAEDVANELKVLRAPLDAEWFVSGDKYGVLRFVSSLFPVANSKLIVIAGFIHVSPGHVLLIFVLTAPRSQTSLSIQWASPV